MSLLTSSAPRWHAQCMGVWAYSPPGHHDGMPCAWVCEPTHLQGTMMARPVHGCVNLLTSRAPRWHAQCMGVWTYSPPVHHDGMPSAWVCEPTHLQGTTMACPVHGCVNILTSSAPRWHAECIGVNLLTSSGPWWHAQYMGVNLLTFSALW